MNHQNYGKQNYNKSRYTSEYSKYHVHNNRDESSNRDILHIQWQYKIQIYINSRKNWIIKPLIFIFLLMDESSESEFSDSSSDFKKKLNDEVKNRTKYVVICGCTLSGIGKGTTLSSIGITLKSSGFNVTCIKIDP